MHPTKIEWTGLSWNPVTGCTKMGPGCRHCYAERMSHRLKGRYGYPADEPFRLTLHPDRLDEPLLRKKPAVIFVCSMGDLFHGDVPDDFIERVWITMAVRPQHRFIILTKRPERMRDWVWKYWREPPRNICVGTSAEDQERYDERAYYLMSTPAACRVLSLEPLLGLIDLGLDKESFTGPLLDSQKRPIAKSPPRKDCIDWVIVGAERKGSRPGRKCEWDWVRKITGAARQADIPLFVKTLFAAGQPMPQPLRQRPEAFFGEKKDFSLTDQSR